MNKLDCLRIRYFLHCLFHRNGFDHASFLKKHNCFHNQGERCFFQPYNLPADAKLIQLGNNVVIATDVTFVCHDVMHYCFNQCSPEYSGEVFKAFHDIIVIKDNVFIGAGAILLPGITIGPNAIVAAGAVVNKDVDEGTIVGGVPAKTIGSFEDIKKERWNYSNSELGKMRKSEKIGRLWDIYDDKEQSKYC